MKSLKKLAAGMLLGACLLMAFGCAMKKEPVAAADFAARMEEKGYDIVDVTGRMGGQVASATLAVGENAAYQIEFYEVETEQQAKTAYAQNKATFEAEKGSFSSNYSNNGVNFNLYSQKSDGWYRFICRVERTFVYASVPEQYRDAVQEAVKALGYS